MDTNIAGWVKTFSLPTEDLRLEFFDRLENLCEYDYKMSDELRGALRNWFPNEALWLQFVHLVEQYSDLTIPRVTGEMESIFRKIIPEPYYLAWRRIFDRTCEVPVERNYIFYFNDIDPDDYFFNRFTVNGVYDNSFTDTTGTVFTSPDVNDVIQLLMEESGFTPGFTFELTVGADWATLEITCVDDVVAVQVFSDADISPSVFEYTAIAYKTDCTGACITINSINDLPADSSGCPAGILYFVDPVNALNSSPYEWDGSEWQRVITIEELDFPHTVIRGILREGWECCLNYQNWFGFIFDNIVPSPWEYITASELETTYSFPSGTGSWDFIFTFKRTDTGCVFANPDTVPSSAQIPAPPNGQCIQDSGWIDTGDPNFVFGGTGTINGNLASDEIFSSPTATTAYILSTFGFTPVGVTIEQQSDFVTPALIRIQVYRLTTDPEIPDFGVFSAPDALPDPIVDQEILSLTSVCNPL